jgi:hypothetical protein
MIIASKPQHTPDWYAHKLELAVRIGSLTQNDAKAFLTERDALRATVAELTKALWREYAANTAILTVVSEAFDRLTDNDMMPPNERLSRWLAKAKVCLAHGSSDQTRTALAKAKAQAQVHADRPTALPAEQ